MLFYVNKEGEACMFDDYSSLFDIKTIEENKNFWLVRTKKGFFYDEYVDNQYIALGWNTLEKEKINSIESDDDLKLLKEEIEMRYDTKQGTTIINKCKRFINEMQEGDIVMLPSHHNNSLAFAIVGDYYEEEECTYAKEIEVNKLIDDGIDYGTKVECPYKKRRKIEIIKTINGERLNPNLYKVLASYHGISTINKYANFILSSIYNFYIWHGKLNFVINIEEKNGINAKYFSELIYYMSDILTMDSDDIKVYTQANVNSPGDVIASLTTQAGNFAQYLCNNWLGILVLWGAISGIKIGPIELKSIPELVLKVHAHIRENKGISLDNSIKEIDLENKKLDLEERKIQRLNEAKGKIEEAASNLKVNKQAGSNIIKVNFDQKGDE